MAERYSKLFSLDSALYSPDAPVMVAAGALLKDSYSAHTLAQIKYINLSQETVVSLKVRITLFNAAGEKLPQQVEYQYPELNAPQDAEFGRNVAVVLPKENVCSFSVSVTGAAFAGGGRWTAGKEIQWRSVPLRQTLEEALGDRELAVQYQVRYGSDCRYAPQALEEGLWYCTCGAVNEAGAEKCRRCRRAFNVMKSVNIDDLRTETAGRLKVEEQFEQEDKAEAQVKNQKRIKLAKIVAPILALAVVLAALLPQQLKAMKGYREAQALLENHQYEQAAEAFAALGQYRDSAVQAEQNVPYQRALYILSLGDAGNASSLYFIGKSRDDIPTEEFGEKGVSALFYQAAIEIFTQLDGYRDSRQQVIYCNGLLDGLRQEKLAADYDATVKLLEAGNYVQAREAFLAMDGYEDSQDMAKEAVYQKAIALCGFIEKYSPRYIYAKLSTESGTPSAFSILRSKALDMGTAVVGELSAACGGDENDIQIVDEFPEDQRPLLDCLTELFQSLDGYKDSAGYLEKVSLAGDYTRPFYQLCEEGDLYAAYDWLTSYEEDFEDRDRWMELLEFYMPFCGDWRMNTGDPTLIPLSAGASEQCLYLWTGIVLDLESATLRIGFEEGGEEYAKDLDADYVGSDRFTNHDEDYVTYFSTINPQSGRLVYVKYDAAGNMSGSCDYTRA